MITVTLFSRDDCHLCEQALVDLEFLQSEIPHRLVVIDVDGDKDLQRAYGFEVPVVEVGPYRLKAPFDRSQLSVTLGAANHRQQQLQTIDREGYANRLQRGQTWSKSDRFAYWFANHYMSVFNILVLIYLSLPFFAPFFVLNGFNVPANIIYKAYGITCHQLAFRSFFLFGDQFVYPRNAAEIEGIKNYSQATGLGEGSTSEDLLDARSYIGEEGVGYKVALCQRDIAIYGGILLFGLIFTISGKRIPGLPWYLWLLLGILPIAIDGFSQMLSQPPFNLWAFRESTPLFRTLTGFLFGFTTAWFGYPMVEDSMADTRRILAAKKIRIMQKVSVTDPVD